MIDFPGNGEACAKTKLSSQNGKRTRGQLNASIFARLGLTSIHTRDSCLVDADQPILEIEVSEHESNRSDGLRPVKKRNSS